MRCCHLGKKKREIRKTYWKEPGKEDKLIKRCSEGNWKKHKKKMCFVKGYRVFDDIKDTSLKKI